MSALRDKTNLLPVDDLVREFRAEFSKMNSGLDVSLGESPAVVKKSDGKSKKKKKKKKQESALAVEEEGDGPAMATTSSSSSRPCLRESTRMASFTSRRLARATEPIDTEKDKVEEEEQRRPWACERMKKTVRVYSRKRITRV